MSTQQFTRNIDLDSARDLLERVPRACIGFADAQGPQAQPVTFVWLDKRYFIGIPDAVKRQPDAGQEVVLLVDEGVFFYDLRAVYVRGHVQPTLPPPNAQGSHRWFELFPIKIVAWDYGTLHEVEVPDEH
ncbi:MAG: hypothetical protein KF716_09540 [Anaerolineae bacterium]|nr:hypothetical protein [Anaerolineae bacterium]